MTLLFDRCRLRVALRHNDTPQVASILARDLLPYRLPAVSAESDFTVRLRWIEEDSPPVVGHLHIAELRPPGLIDTRGRSQIHVVLVGAFRSHFAPPL